MGIYVSKSDCAAKAASLFNECEFMASFRCGRCCGQAARIATDYEYFLTVRVLPSLPLIGEPEEGRYQ